MGEALLPGDLHQPESLKQDRHPVDEALLHGEGGAAGAAVAVAPAVLVRDARGNPVAGVAVTLLGSVGPNLGGNYIVDCFMVVVLGGVGKLAGTVLAALGIGVLSYIVGSGSLLLVWPAMPAGLNELITFFATTSMAKVLVFAVIVVFLQIRPAGLFPQKGRMVEA